MQRLLASVGVVCMGMCAAIGISAARTATPAHAQSDLPPGPGKAIVERSCTACHGVDNILGKRGSKDDWQNTVDTMVSRGADLTDKEIPIVVKYLADNFPDKPAAATGASGATAPAAPAKQ